MLRKTFKSYIIYFITGSTLIFTLTKMVVIHSEEVLESFDTNILDSTDESLLVNENYKYKPNDDIEGLLFNPIKRLLINSLYLKL